MQRRSEMLEEAWLSQFDETMLIVERNDKLIKETLMAENPADPNAGRGKPDVRPNMIPIQENLDFVKEKWDLPASDACYLNPHAGSDVDP